MDNANSEITLDSNILPFAVLFLLLTGKHEKIIDSPKRKSAGLAADTSRKKVKLQTYVRATTSEEYIEVERTEENGQRSYKVEARLEPLVATDTITEQITMRDVNVKLELSNLNIQGVSTLNITGKSSNKTPSATEINFEIPETVTITSDYKLKGKINDKLAEGSGTLEVSILGVTLFGMIDVTDNGKELALQSLTLSYNFKDIKVSYTGLTVEGINTSQVDKYVNEIVSNYFKDNAKEVSTRLSKNIRNRLNRKLKGVSSVKIMTLLKGV